MSRAARIGFVLLASFLTATPYPECVAQALRLEGYVSDAYSQSKITGATMYALVDKQRLKITESGTEGRYRLEFPVAGQALIVEKTGYRTLVIPTLKQPAAPGDLPFFVPLPLIPLDEQAHDKPYMQSQQQDYTLTTTTETKTQKKVIRTFSIQDAVSSQPIQKATLCLQYTKVEKKDCHEITPAVPTPSVTFEDADIVSVVVESAGYQPYQGNLILDKMDGSHSSYEIKMTPEITLLTMNVPNASPQVRYMLISTTGDTIPIRQGKEKSAFARCAEGTYSLRVLNAQGVPWHREVVQLAKGLNYRTLTLPPPPAGEVDHGQPVAKASSLPPVADDAVPLADTARRIILYFIQSTYELQPQACQQLDRLVLMLRNSPDRNIRIEGHSDNVGNPVRNETLSEYRARKVYRYLQERGIAASRMEWRGKGSAEPKASNDSEETRKINRRVEIQIYPQ
ncbi:OmpA family protein [Salmonirosea aquatica]